MKFIIAVVTSIINWFGRYGDLLHAQVDRFEMELSQQRLELLKEDIATMGERHKKELSAFDYEQVVKRDNFIANLSIEFITKRREYTTLHLRHETLQNQVAKLEERVLV